MTIPNIATFDHSTYIEHLGNGSNGGSDPNPIGDPGALVRHCGCCQHGH